MTANSPGAYSLSVMLHGAFVAAMLFTAFALRDETARKSTKVFELVAGEGSNWGATEAPALGTPDGVKFQPAATPVVQARPEPVAPPQPEPVIAAQPEPTPVTPAPVQAEAPPKVEPKKTTPPPQKTFVQQVQQTAARREKQIVTKFRREEAAREKREAAERAKKEAADKAAAAKRMTKEEFDAKNGKQVASNTKAGATSYEKVSTKGITSGVSGGTTDQPGAGGKALSRAEQDQLGTYFALLKQKLKAAHEKPAGVSDQLSTRVSFHVSAGGAISQVKIVKSSGNTEYDQSVLAAFRAVESIGPRPDGRGDTNEATFNMRDTD